MKLVSWAEPAPKGCETDLEGSAPPARFRLRYRERGREPVTIDSSVEELFAAGWTVVSRTGRGYGFEKACEFTTLYLDVVEELRCSCGSSWKKNALVHVKIDWKPGAPPEVTARLEDGERSEAVQPAVMNGRLAVYEFRFTRPLPSGYQGQCSSRFFAALNLPEPLE